jgi:hypothetical protein
VDASEWRFAKSADGIPGAVQYPQRFRYRRINELNEIIISFSERSARTANYPHSGHARYKESPVPRIRDFTHITHSFNVIS